MKIVMLEAATVSRNDVSFDDIYALGEVTEYPLTPNDRIVEYIGDAEAVLCNKTPLTAEVLEKCPKLEYIGECATGFNNIDIEAAKRLGITVCNVPAYSDNAVAQQVFSFILHFASRVADYNSFVGEKGWINSPSFAAMEFPAAELSGKTLGIVGFGRIGKTVANIAAAFGMKVTVNTRTVRNEDGVEFVSFEELMKRSDYITLHCPLTPETTELVNKKALSLCKPSAVLINTSRGPVVNEYDLAEALEKGIIAGAGLDVLKIEPMAEDCPLFGAKNCVITPHVAWAPLETRVRLMKTVAENLAAYISGNPINKVN
ncbi:MAG: D-2-hydroxyacid dehydrogenase [Oscillospiraceae bacterium]|nr:D-2-hydroxyacid dehydrogenase [Oscillospiraceae bacterium]